MMKTLIHKALIINEGRSFKGSVLLEGAFISKIFEGTVPQEVLDGCQVLDAEGKWLIPGAIDGHVHFREPGLTHKADLLSETRAALAGGVTSFLEMPNTLPQTTTIQIWEKKMELAASKSLANYSFYLGATNDNLSELEKADYQRVCGVKVFMGSSTGNMLVGQQAALEGIFKSVPCIVGVHAESEAIIQANKTRYLEAIGGDLPISYHPLIRSAEACYASSATAVELATRFGSRLHILHLTTAEELDLFEAKPLIDKKITAEVCVPHLWFDDKDYEFRGNSIKCNPAIKTERDRLALRDGLKSGKLDVIATDHAPHLWAEKQGDCLTAASGSPSIQFSVPLMLELVKDQIFTKELIVEKMCHAPATLYGIDRRGFIRENYYADMALIDPEASWVLTGDLILSKCGWSPYEEQVFRSKVLKTWVNGTLAYDEGHFAEGRTAAELRFII
ncbi:MAG TPA: dihydroorotase [Bacteroidales bacterium]|nr:dihydroorotase [Bacteroidales bacterium]